MHVRSGGVWNHAQFLINNWSFYKINIICTVLWPAEWGVRNSSMKTLQIPADGGSQAWWQISRASRRALEQKKSSRKNRNRKRKAKKKKKKLTRVSAGSGLSSHKWSDRADREHSCVAVWISTSAFRFLSRLITSPFCKRNHTNSLAEIHRSVLDFQSYLAIKRSTLAMP